VENNEAVLDAETITHAPLESSAATDYVLTGLEAAGSMVGQPTEQEAAFDGGSEPATAHTGDARHEPLQIPGHNLDRQSYGILWETELPVHNTAPPAASAGPGRSSTEAPEESWWESFDRAKNALQTRADGEPIEYLEPIQPLPPNLIEFPRELVAARKVRPRLADGPFAAAGGAEGQLSIFEVDPGSISTEPAFDVIADTPTAWPATDWSSIRLDEPSAQKAEAADRQEPVKVLAQPTSISLRLMATVVDCSLMTGAFLGAAVVAMENARDLPAFKEIEISAAVAMLAIGVIYQAFFLALGAPTPGMNWAQLSLRTFANKKPTLGQRCGRFAALLLSLLPVGLGLAWAIFDEEHLSWHDRLSGTYLKKH
jgi:uncharacterized RDD family membrane protein YckC